MSIYKPVDSTCEQGRSTRILALACAMVASASVLWASSVKTQQQQGGVPRGSDKSELKEPSETKPSRVPEGEFILQVDNKEITPTINLIAKEARVAAIAARLSTELGVPVKLGPAISKQEITLDLDGLTLEGLLRYLAAKPYVDYVAGGHDMGQPKALAIYLYGLNESPPSPNETSSDRNQSLYVQGDSGDTEEGTEEYKRREKKEPLEVTFTDNRLSVRAEKQSLNRVVTRIAIELRIPYDVEGETTEVLSVNFKGYPIDQAMRLLSPSIRFYYRADLTNFENQLTRMVLKSP